MSRKIDICDNHPFAGEVLDHTCYVCKSERLEKENERLKEQFQATLSSRSLRWYFAVEDRKVKDFMQTMQRHVDSYKWERDGLRVRMEKVEKEALVRKDRILEQRKEIQDLKESLKLYKTWNDNQSTMITELQRELNDKTRD